MKRFLLLAYLLLQFSIFSNDLEAYYMDWQVRSGAFFPVEGKVRKIYSDAWPFYMIETTFHFAQPWEPMPWKVWINAAYFNKKGHSLGLHKKTTYQLCPISMGLNYNWYCDRWQGYLGLGFNVSHIHFKDDSRFVHEHVGKTNFGGNAKAGMRYWFGNVVFIDFFADYYYCKFKFHGKKHRIFRHEVDASGPFVGVGLGYAF